MQGKLKVAVKIIIISVIFIIFIIPVNMLRAEIYTDYLDFETDVELAREIGAEKNYYDIDTLIEEMNTRRIYGIARFVVFKDSILPKSRPEMAIKDSRNGKPLRLEGSYWPDIYCEEVWDYYIEIIKELALQGAREFKLYYIRAPARGNTAYAEYTYNTTGKDK